MKMSRKEFLAGSGGLVLGGTVAALAQHQLARRQPEPTPPPAPPIEEHANLSYAQSGEDLIVRFILQTLRIKDISYLDIGAYDPIQINNTYLFYREGHRGVLVEPNPALADRLRAVRPRDKTLVAGIGVAAARQADYFVMSEPSWSTFSREEAEHQVWASGGRVTIEKVIQMPLLGINEVMAEHFVGPPTFVSVDAEGLHLAILKTLDFDRFRPTVICVETLVSGTNQSIAEIPAFLHSRGYVVRGGTMANGIFVDERVL